MRGGAPTKPRHPPRGMHVIEADTVRTPSVPGLVAEFRGPTAAARFSSGTEPNSFRAVEQVTLHLETKFKERSAGPCMGPKLVRWLQFDNVATCRVVRSTSPCGKHAPPLSVRFASDRASYLLIPTTDQTVLPGFVGRARFGRCCR